MTNTNDERILKLKMQIENKKNSLSSVARFSPITNCSIELDGERFNIQTLDQNMLITLLIKLNSYMVAAKEIGYENHCYSGYPLQDWIEDVKSRLDIFSYREEQTKLKKMEDKLSKMLSDEKKTQLEIDEIEDMLKEK